MRAGHEEEEEGDQTGQGLGDDPTDQDALSPRPPQPGTRSCPSSLESPTPLTLQGHLESLQGTLLQGDRPDFRGPEGGRCCCPRKAGHPAPGVATPLHPSLPPTPLSTVNGGVGVLWALQGSLSSSTVSCAEEQKEAPSDTRLPHPDTVSGPLCRVEPAEPGKTVMLSPSYREVN